MSEELAFLMTAAKKYPVLSKPEQYELIEAAQAGDLVAREKVINHNLRFVVSRAHKYKGYTTRTGITLSDLVQEGCLGLAKSVDKFDTSTGYSLITYAIWWVDSYIKGFLIKNFHLVKFGTNNAERKLFFNRGKAAALFAALYDDNMDEVREQVADSVGVPVSAVINFEERMKSSGEISLNVTVGNADEGNTTHMDNLTYPDNEELLDKYTKEEVIDMFNDSDITPRQKHIIRERFLSSDPKTLQAIAKEYNISRERVRQIQCKALAALRVDFEEMGFGKELVMS